VLDPFIIPMRKCSKSYQQHYDVLQECFLATLADAWVGCTPVFGVSKTTIVYPILHIFTPTPELVIAPWVATTDEYEISIHQMHICMCCLAELKQNVYTHNLAHKPDKSYLTVLPAVSLDRYSIVKLTTRLPVSGNILTFFNVSRFNLTWKNYLPLIDDYIRDNKVSVWGFLVETDELVIIDAEST
jgi:hypothetical protein